MDKKCIERLPIWIRLPGLAFEHWDMELLSKIASTVGKPFSPDTSTVAMDWLSYARICVEITTESPLPKVVKMKDENDVVILQEIVYEWVLFQCEKCHLLGHKDEICVAKMVYKPVEEVSASGASELVEEEQNWRGRPKSPGIQKGDQDLECDAIVNTINTSVMFPEISVESLKFMLSVVYATNLRSTRQVLWKKLLDCGQLVGGKPWLLMGDFNVVLDHDEAQGEGRLQLSDVKGLSDHSLLKVHINEEVIQYGCSFKYHSFWRSHPSYDDILAKCWDVNVDGTDLYAMKHKTNLVKKELLKLNKEHFGNISKRVEDKAKEFYGIQKSILQGQGSEENYKEENKLREELSMF
ncbi:hypothetical protein LIER_37553 [Lithospermum erythrorhizon]|uniref:DUF4283 domain-containing protein n=1 Tax=Lithospermum erythrorhizon TaxID=34254 RepID=A0AAV3PNZ5_LITER